VVFIFVLELNDFWIIKILAYPFLYFSCVLISVHYDCVFDTGAYGVADGYVEDHLGRVVLLGIG